VKKQDVLAELPQELHGSVKIVDKGDSCELTHDYIKDKEVWDRAYNTLCQNFKGKYFGYYDGKAHWIIPKPSVPKEVTATYDKDRDKLAKDAVAELEKQRLDAEKKTPPSMETHEKLSFMTTPEGTVQQAPIELLVADRFSVRKIVDEQKFNRLRESIRFHGDVLKPLAVLPLHEGRLEILGGHLRRKAAEEAGLTSVTVRVHKPKTEADCWAIAFAEDMQQPWTVMDKARAYKRMQKSSILVEEMSRITQESVSVIQKLLRLTELPEYAQELVDHGKLPYSHALELLSLKDKPEQVVGLAQKIGAEAWTIPRLRQEISKIQAPLQKTSDLELATSLEEKSPVPEKTVTPPSSPSPVQCVACPNSTLEPMTFKVQGHSYPLCPTCYMKAQLHHPAEFERKFILPRLTSQKELVKPSKTEKTWKETAEHRRAVMHPAVSKFDEAMLIRLQNNVKLRENGWTVEFQKRYVKVLCVSDVTLTNPKQGREIMCFFDHPETHKHPDRDEERRLEAASIHHTESLPLPYKACTDKEGIRCENRILEALEV